LAEAGAGASVIAAAIRLNEIAFFISVSLSNLDRFAQRRLPQNLLASADGRFLGRLVMAVNRSDSRTRLAVMTHNMADHGTLGGALYYAPRRCGHRT
jgi:hypothetical protein